jgi:hypothetical protein
VAALLPLFFTAPARAQQGDDTLSVAGSWRFEMDSADQGIQQAFYARTLPGTIRLPGSMVQNGKGYPVTLDTRWTGSIYDSSWYFNPRMAKYRQPGNLKFPFFLTPLTRYVGPAWYQKTVVIPQGWKNHHIILFLERAHWQTRVWVDTVAAGRRNSLSAPHVYDLSGLLSPGKHTLTIRVDNRIGAVNPGPDSHSVTDQTQGNWNGIVGRMSLIASPSVRITRLQTFPDPEHKMVKVVLGLSNGAGRTRRGNITLSARSFNTDSAGHRQVAPLTAQLTMAPGDTTVVLRYPMGAHPLLWDEFHPALYRLRAVLTSRAGTDEKKTDFGMRTFGISGTRFTVNGRPVFLRGTVENCDFPITGYAPMDLQSWMRVFRICKSYGLNEMRFHSYCPPRAAFQAADREGFYLHVEGPSWANHGSSLGDGRPIDRYIYAETDRIDSFYGNHPSFCMMAYGNEPRGGHQVQYLNKFVDYWKARDPRHLYTGASTGMSWPWVNQEQFIVRSGPRGLPWAKERPGTMFDHRAALRGHDIPYVAHEVGQYCAFPDFSEIKKYTGVHKAKNFTLFRQDLADHHMAGEARRFLMSSGKLQLLCYKAEVEAALRTPGFAGFELLALNDYSGQGTALVGVLNVFWQSKGYVTPAAFRRFCSPVVPLARLPRFVYNEGDTLKASVEIANFSQGVIARARPRWQLTDMSGQVVAQGALAARDIPVGNGISLGSITEPLRGFAQAQKLKLSVWLAGTRWRNDWNIWVYPPSRLTRADSSKIYFCDSLDRRAREVLSRGGKVFLLCAGRVKEGKDISMHFLPVFWNTSWFRMRPPHTTGITLDPGSPAFKYFPTADFSDLQWWSIVNRQQVMWLTEFPADFRPLVQPIDTWFLNRRLGLVFEARVGGGKLLVCSADLTSHPDTRPAARQLLYSLTRYMESPDFHPRDTVALSVIRDLFTVDASGEYDPHSRDVPDELKKHKHR